MNNSVKKIAKTGYVAKGLVYAITGILAVGATLGLGRQSSEGKLGVLKFLKEQPFGNALSIILGLGLLCYAFWRFYQSITDPENIGSDKKGTGKRIGFFLSGTVYLGLGVYAIYQTLNQSGASGGSNNDFIPIEYLDYVFYAVAIGLSIKAVFQFVKAYKGKFLKKFHLDHLSNLTTRNTIKWLGYAGMISRGIVVGIISSFFFRAADTASQNEIKGTSEAFGFLRKNSEGPWLVGTIALGLIAYSLYMFVMAKYRRFNN